MRYRTPRYATDLPVALGTPVGEVAVMVSNISRRGLRVRGPRMVPKNTPVTLVVQGQPLTGRIAWSSAHAAGVALDADLTAQQITVLRRVAVPPHMVLKRSNWAHSAGLRELR